MADRERKETDGELFRQAMLDVKPLRAPARSQSKAPHKPARPPVVSIAVEEAVPTDRGERHSGASDDDTSHRKHGVQIRLLQKLKRGRFPPADTLDLHHLTVARGLPVLHRFLDEARTNGMQCVRVIHGKGLRSSNGPRLKLAVQQALREHAAVLAFTMCKPADGGSGAVDVLLKSS